jgi:hypothetical protein
MIAATSPRFAPGPDRRDGHPDPRRKHLPGRARSKSARAAPHPPKNSPGVAPRRPETPRAGGGSLSARGREDFSEKLAKNRFGERGALLCTMRPRGVAPLEGDSVPGPQRIISSRGCRSCFNPVTIMLMFQNLPFPTGIYTALQARAEESGFRFAFKLSPKPDDLYFPLAFAGAASRDSQKSATCDKGLAFRAVLAPAGEASVELVEA